MKNYIRACFCIEQLLHLKDLANLQTILQKKDISFVGRPDIQHDRWINQNLVWNIENNSYSGKIYQALETHKYTTVSFDIDSLTFLPNSEISYFPNDDKLFSRYEDILVEWILFINPRVGIVDFDADLLCETMQVNSLKAWGNYFSPQVLSMWPTHLQDQLLSLVDKFVWLKNNGLLVFNHPLGYSTPTEKQRRFWKLIGTENLL